MLRRLIDRLILFWFPVLLLFILCTSIVFAKSVAQLNHDGITVTLTDEPCQLDIKLPYVLSWRENGKLFTGCYTVHGGIVVAYFSEDKSIALFPGQLFRPLTEL